MNKLHDEMEPVCTGSIVDHIEHIEDLPILYGSRGAEIAIESLFGVSEFLLGRHNPHIDVSIKFDGSFSLIAGWNGYRFFVAKKSIFNKTPIYYQSEKEIRESGLSDDLIERLVLCWRLLPPTIPSDKIYQGDFMYSGNDVLFENQHGSCWTIQPNTLVYGQSSFRGNKPFDSQIGIAWHTEYTGNIGELVAKETFECPDGGKQVCVFDPHRFLIDPDFVDFDRIADIQNNFLKNPDAFDRVAGNQEFGKLYKQYMNACTKGSTKTIFEFMTDYFRTELDKRKTNKGKEAVDERYKTVAKILNGPDLLIVIQLMSEIQKAKHELIKSLDKMTPYKVFYRTVDWKLYPTNHEGYVVKYFNSVVKFVNRAEFSRLNFSKDILKGWENR